MIRQHAAGEEVGRALDQDGVARRNETPESEVEGVACAVCDEELASDRRNRGRVLEA